MLISLLSGLVFGLVPAWKASHKRVAPVLQETRQGAADRGWRRTRNLFVVTEVALSIVLLAGAD